MIYSYCQVLSQGSTYSNHDTDDGGRWWSMMADDDDKEDEDENGRTYCTAEMEKIVYMYCIYCTTICTVHQSPLIKLTILILSQHY